MRAPRLTLAALGAGAALAPPATASPLHTRYEHAYHAVAHKLGHRAPGRDIVRFGLRNHKPAPPRAVVRSLGVLYRMLAPPPPVMPPSPATASVPVTPAPAPVASPTAPVTGGLSGSYSIPSAIVQCESGGNWSAVNPSSGAGGAYQILPSTWAAYGGTGSPQSASPAQQSAIAAKIWAAQGPSAWVC